ncbi:hypothetical protein CELD12_01390 [Cellulomonas sp. NTE-D12]|nr:hypothetical protein CELD12_01390 [Cellulomonas sp. NTE-D12]
MSRSDRYRLGDILTAIDAIDRAEVIAQRYSQSGPRSADRLRTACEAPLVADAD